MAKHANIVTTTERKVVTREVTTVKAVELSLSLQEFATLVIILNRIGGCPTNSPRKYAKSLHEKVSALIPETRANEDATWPSPISGAIHQEYRSIYFLDGFDQFNQLVESVNDDLVTQATKGTV